MSLCPTNTKIPAVFYTYMPKQGQKRTASVFLKSIQGNARA